MTYQKFIKLLEENPDLKLSFEYSQGKFVREDFHITEVKNVTFDTVDCGGVQNKWSEVHLQLWEAAELQPDHKVDTSKALSICNAVKKVRETLEDVELKFEYGNAGFHTATLEVNSYIVSSEGITIKLGEEHTTCKAADRQSAAGEEVTACCGPAVAGEKMKVNLGDLISSNNKCC